MGTLSLKLRSEPLELNTDRFVPGRPFVVFNRFDNNLLVLSLKGTLPTGARQALFTSPLLHEICKAYGKPIQLSNDDSFFSRENCTMPSTLKWNLAVHPHVAGNKTYWTLSV